MCPMFMTNRRLNYDYNYYFYLLYDQIVCMFLCVYTGNDNEIGYKVVFRYMAYDNITKRQEYKRHKDFVGYSFSVDIYIYIYTELAEGRFKIKLLELALG